MHASPIVGHTLVVRFAKRNRSKETAQTALRDHFFDASVSKRPSQTSPHIEPSVLSIDNKTIEQMVQRPNV